MRDVGARSRGRSVAGCGWGGRIPGAVSPWVGVGWGARCARPCGHARGPSGSLLRKDDKSSTVRCCAARHGTAQSSTAQRGTERHRHGAAWHRAALRGRGIATPWCCLSGRNAAHVHPHSSSCARQQLISGQQRSSAQGKRGGSALPRVGEGADRQNVFASGCKSCRTIAGNLLYKCRQGIATNNRSEGRHGGNREARALISGRCLNNGRAAKEQTGTGPRDSLFANRNGRCFAPRRGRHGLASSS